MVKFSPCIVIYNKEGYEWYVSIGPSITGYHLFTKMPHHTVRSLARVFLATMEPRSQSHTV